MWLQLAMVVAVLGQAAGPLSLQDCLREALAHHPDLGLAELGVEAARVDKKATRAGYLPTLTVQSNDGFTFQGRTEGSRYVDPTTGQAFTIEPRDAQVDDNHGFGIYLRQPLFDGLRYWYQPQRAERAIVRAELDIQVTREGIALQAVEAFFHLLGQLKAQAVLAEALQLSQAQLEFARERHRLGAASRVDVSRAKLAVGEDRIAIERQKVAVAQASVSLNKAMGRKPDAPVQVSEQGTPQVPASEEVEPGVNEEHVRLRRNLVSEEIAELDVEISSSRLFPTVTGSASYSRNDPEFYKVYSRFDRLYNASIGVSISYPIFEGFSTQAAIEAAEVQAERVRRERAQLEHELNASLAAAAAELSRLQTVHQIEAENVTAAKDSLTLAQERYAVGEGTALEIRDAQLAVTRAKLAQVQTTYDLQLALVRLHEARGDLLETYLPEEQP